MSTNTLTVPFNVPTNLEFVGASKGPYVLLTNVEVVADCNIVKACGLTTT